MLWINLLCGEGVAIQPFQTPPMSRPRFHSCHAEPAANKLAFENFNLLPVKDTNGRKTTTSSAAAEKFELAADLEDGDVIPVKDVVVAKENTPADKQVIIFDKDMEDKFKSTDQYLLRTRVTTLIRKSL